MSSRIVPIDRAHLDEAIRVVTEAYTAEPNFAELFGVPHPVPAESVGPTFRRISLWCAEYGYPSYGFVADDDIVGAVSYLGPVRGRSRSALRWLRIHARLWMSNRALGPTARRRFDAYSARATSQGYGGRLKAPHHHVFQVGVTPGNQRGGIGRALLEHVERAAEQDTLSAGVGLDTWCPSLVDYYTALGYEVRAHGTIADEDIDVWTMFKAT